MSTDAVSAPPDLEQTSRYAHRSSDGRTQYTLDQDSDRPVLRYELVNHMLAGAEQPTIAIYADGRVIIENPAYMKDAGRHTRHLPREELTAILDDALDSGFAEMDRSSILSKVRSEKARLRSQGRFAAVSDRATTLLEIDVEDYRRDSGTMRRLKKTISVDNLEFKHRTYRNVPEIEDLYRIRSTIETLRNRPRKGRE